MSDLETQARAAGYGWDEIDEYTQGATGDALAQGFSQDQVDRYMGFDPGAVAQRADTAIGMVPGVPSDPDTGALDLSGIDWKGSYANSLRQGETRGTYDWADSVAAAALDRMDISDPTTKDKALGWAGRAGDQMAADLPGRREFTDAALDISGAHPDDPSFETVRRNLIDHWQDTGEGPVSAAGRSRVNSDLNEKLTAEPPQRGIVGEVAAGVARAAGSALFGVEHIANAVEKIAGQLTDSDTIKQIANTDIANLAKREAAWMDEYKRGAGIGAFVEGTIGEAIPTIAEYVVAGVPRMVMYGALHGASAAWERTGSATAAATGALIGGAEAEAPAPFLHGAAGQGFVQAAVKGAVGMGAMGGLAALADPIPDWVAGKGYALPTVEQLAEGVGAGAITGALVGAFGQAARPKIKLIDPTPDMPDRVVPIDHPDLQPTPELHTQAQQLALDATRMEQLRLEREGLVPGNATESGGFFSRKAAEEGALDPYPLAEGYRAAFSFRAVADDLFGPLWRDQSGSMKLGGRVSMSDADREAMRSRADIVDQAVRYNEAFKDRYNTDVRKDLQPLYKMVEPHIPEWKAALASKDIDRIKDTKIGQLIAHMEGVDGYELPGNHELRPFAETARNLNLTSRAYLEREIARGNMGRMSFIKDYWAHLWKDPNSAERIFGSPTRARTVPDTFQGLEAGLELLHEHPVDLLFHDLTRKSAMWNRAAVVGHLAGKYETDAEGNVLLDHDGIPKGRDPSAPILFTREQPSGNMTPIPGLIRRGVFDTQERARPLSQAEHAAQGEAMGAIQGGSRPADAGGPSVLSETRNSVELQAYASPEIAKMVQAWHDRYSKPTATEDAFAMINRASNAALALKLAIPLYHMATTTTEMIAGALGTLGRLTSGELTTGDISEAVAKATALAKQLHTKGLGLAQTMPDQLQMDPLLDAALKGGFRHGKRQGVYLPGRAPDIIESLSRGTLGRELREEYERDGLGMVPYEVGRALTTAGAPAFDHAIPMLKTITNLAQLELAMRQNPTMGPAERFKAARQIMDNTDHRMGEMNMNNVFWPRWVRRTLSAALISPSWVYGTFAYTAAGLGYRIGPKGLRGAEWNPAATANLVGLAVATAGINGIAQWLWSGKLPGEASLEPFPLTVAKDLFAGARTGGVTKGWAQARMQTPSQVKEYLDWLKIVQETYAGAKLGGWQYGAEKFANAFAKYGDAKVRPMWNGLFALMSMEDAIGQDPALRPGGLVAFLKDQFAPIFLSQWENYRAKSGIGRLGASTGLREMPDWIEDPRRYWGIQQFLYNKRTRDQLRQWRRQQMYLR